jgi:iron(III) transport system permease protein
LKWLAVPVLVAFLAPLAFVTWTAVSPDGYGALAHVAGTVLPIHLGNTLLLAGIASALALAAGGGAAFLVTFFRFPGRAFLDLALVLPLTLPTYLVAMVYREMSHRQGWSPQVDSVAAASVIFAATLYPYVYLLARAAFRRQAMVYLEVGRSLGLHGWQIATRGLLPLAMPALMLGTLLVVVEVISDFGTVNILGVRTLSTMVYRAWFDMYDPSLAAQLALIGALLPLSFLVIYGVLIRGKGFHNPVNRPRAPVPTELQGGWRVFAPIYCGLPVVVGFAWPLAVLLHWAAGAFDRFRLDALYEGLIDTLVVAGGTTAMAMIIGLGLALAARDGGWTRAGPWILSVNYAIPAILLAIAVLVFSGWIYELPSAGLLTDGLALVLVATTLRFSAFAYFSIDSGLQGVSRRVDEALLCVGRHRWAGVVRVILPLIRGPLVVGAMLVFVIAAKELTLSMVLQPFGFRSLALSLYYFADIELYGPAAIYALCLLLLVIYPVLSINRWFGSR